MFPVSLNPYFNPTLSFSQPFTNPEWAMRAYAQHAWDPFQAQAYYRGTYPGAMSGIDPSLFSPATHSHPAAINPINAQSQLPIGFMAPSMQNTPQFGYGNPSFFGHLSPHEFGFGGQTSSNLLSPEFQEFIRAELLRSGRAIRTLSNALENDNEQVRSQAHIALTAQFFYALGLLYTRGVIIARDVPGASSDRKSVV